MSRPLVSFVVPCFNYGRYLRPCLDSILGQQGIEDIEIILIDDASTDDTAEVAAGYSDGRIRFLRHPANLGHVATVNEGMRLARGEYLVRTDPDDRYRPIFLSSALEKFRQYSDVGLVYGNVALIDENGAVTVEGADQTHGGRDFRGNEFVALLADNFICAPTLIAPRERWLEVGPVPQGLAFNDWYFNLMMTRRADSYYVQRVLAEYRVHPANHHRKVVADRTEEPSIFRILDQIYSEVEQDPALEIAKRAARARVYAAQYLTLANKYFGLGMKGDARRCYLKALRNRPVTLTRADWRRLLATWLPRSSYEWIKKALHKRDLAAHQARNQ